MSQVTFTEDSFKKAQAFVALVVADMQLKDSADFKKMQECMSKLADMNQVLKEMHSSILEVKSIKEPEPESKKKASK